MYPSNTPTQWKHDPRLFWMKKRIFIVPLRFSVAIFTNH